MGWWTEARDQILKSTGVDTGANAVKTVGGIAGDLLRGPEPASGGSTALGNAEKKSTIRLESNPFLAQFKAGAGEINFAGFSLAGVALAAALGYFVIKKLK